MSIKTKYKYIQDPLYGMVYLSDVEMRIIDSEAFQRLLNVRQLGYAYAVFPGADYSRFAHCVGTCHNMGLWIETLKKRGNRVDPALGVLYRIAALLHDIGHYPFSHATERAAKNYYQYLKETASEGAGASETPTFYNHERIGSEIIEFDEQVREAILNAGLSFVALQRVYKRHSLDSMSSLLSSDLDADRLDYLRRTAHHSGLPYGRVDHQYLVTQLLLDENDRVCWDQKALGAIDHAFLARYFDYLQIVHNKTVVALELVLESLVRKMLEIRIMDLSVQFVKQRLEAKTWIKIDDHFMFEKIRELQLKSNDPVIVDLCDSLLSRNPPRLLYSYSFIGGYEGVGTFERFKESCKLKVWELADKAGIDRRLCFIWGSPFMFTKYNGGSFIDSEDPVTKNELYEIPRTTLDEKTSLSVLEDPMSLTRLFYTKRKYELRVYVLFPEFKNGKEDRVALSRRSQLQKEFAAALNPIRLNVLGKDPHKRRAWDEHSRDGNTLF